jgi:hypothetical protein
MNVYRLQSDLGKYRDSVVAAGDESAFLNLFNGNPIGRPIQEVTIAWAPDSLRIRVGDYHCVYPSVPVFSRKAVTAMSDLLEANGELLPIMISGEEFFLFNVTRIIDSVDVSRSKIFWSDDETEVLDIDVHVFFPERLEDAVIFKIPQLPTWEIYVTDTFVDRVKSARLKGFWFPLIWSTERPQDVVDDFTLLVGPDFPEEVRKRKKRAEARRKAKEKKKAAVLEEHK